MTCFVYQYLKNLVLLLCLGNSLYAQILPGGILRELDLARKQAQNLLVSDEAESLADALLIRPDLLDRYLMSLRHYLALGGDREPLLNVRVPLKVAIVAYGFHALESTPISTETAANIPGYPAGEIISQVEQGGYIYLTVRTKSQILSSFRKSGPAAHLKPDVLTTLTYDDRSLALALQAGIRIRVRDRKTITYNDPGTISKELFMADSTASAAFSMKSDVAIASMEDHIEVWRAPSVGWEPYKRISQSVQKYETSLGNWITEIRKRNE